MELPFLLCLFEDAPQDATQYLLVALHTFLLVPVPYFHQISDAPGHKLLLFPVAF
jgi:hypothetical protein